MTKIFLGGTCGETTWRDELIHKLRGFDLTYFNPVVSNWTKADIVVEELQKRMKCAIHLYVITKEMKGIYSIAEAVQSSNTNGILTYVHFETNGLPDHLLHSIEATADLLKLNGAYVTFDGGMDTVMKILKNFE